MLFHRFDNARLAPVVTQGFGNRVCGHSDALVRACRLGAGPASRPWWQPWQAPRIEWPYGVFHVHSLDVARRACLQLDRTWILEDAASSAERWRIRLAAQAADRVWWRALGPLDAWDAGIARSVAGLAGFAPRRATLIVVDQLGLDAAAHAVLAGLEQRAQTWPRAVRLVVVGGEPPGYARPLGG